MAVSPMCAVFKVIQVLQQSDTTNSVEQKVCSWNIRGQISHCPVWCGTFLAIVLLTGCVRGGSLGTVPHIHNLHSPSQGNGLSRKLIGS